MYYYYHILKHNEQDKNTQFCIGIRMDEVSVSRRTSVSISAIYGGTTACGMLQLLGGGGAIAPLANVLPPQSRPWPQVLYRISRMICSV